MLEFAGIIILGILAQWVAWRFKIPAILPLILIGLFVGPLSILFSEDSTKWIEPIWNGTEGLFPGEHLFHVVSLAIGIILFEGGLTLKKEEIQKVGPVIGKLISLGSLVTFIGAGLAARYIFELSWSISFLFSALIIVTGPTVIAPILRNIPLKKHVSAVLKWEGILIDPIGALVAVLVFEFIVAGEGEAFTKQALIEFGRIVLIGFTFGFAAGYALHMAIKKSTIPHYLLNVVSLASVLLVYVLSDLFAHESGLLAVVVMGMYLGNSDLPNLKELLYFKESLSVLLISILFILLAANINLEDLYLIYKWETAALFAVIVFVIRPLAVFLSSRGSTLKMNEKLFIGWVGPRGIVAAGIASLFGSKLVLKGEPYAEYITPLVFMIVLGTVLLNATTARFFARIAGVFLNSSEGILIVGGSKIGRLMGAYLNKNGKHVVILDTNSRNIALARELNLGTLNTNIYSDDLVDAELSDVGYLMAMTANTDVNKFAITKFKKEFGENGSFRLAGPDEATNNGNLSTTLFSSRADYFRLEQLARQYPAVQEIEIDGIEKFNRLLKWNVESDEIEPLFIRNEDNDITIMSASYKIDTEVFNQNQSIWLAYLGKTIDEEHLNVSVTTKIEEESSG